MSGIIKEKQCYYYNQIQKGSLGEDGWRQEKGLWSSQLVGGVTGVSGTLAVSNGKEFPAL